MTLTPRQEAFVHEYAVDHSGKHAAIRAGYSPNGAEVTASKLLRNPKVSIRLAAIEQKTTTRLELTAELVLGGLLDIALHGEREANRVRSFELLGKHLALFTDRVEVTQIPDPAMVREWIDALKADIDGAPIPQ